MTSRTSSRLSTKEVYDELVQTASSTTDGFHALVAGMVQSGGVFSTNPNDRRMRIFIQNELARQRVMQFMAFRNIKITEEQPQTRWDSIHPFLALPDGVSALKHLGLRRDGIRVADRAPVMVQTRNQIARRAYLVGHILVPDVSLGYFRDQSSTAPMQKGFSAQIHLVPHTPSMRISLVLDSIAQEMEFPIRLSSNTAKGRVFTFKRSANFPGHLANLGAPLAVSKLPKDRFSKKERLDLPGFERVNTLRSQVTGLKHAIGGEYMLSHAPEGFFSDRQLQAIKARVENPEKSAVELLDVLPYDETKHSLWSLYRRTFDFFDRWAAESGLQTVASVMEDADVSERSLT